MTNAAWAQRSQRAVWHPCTQMKLHEAAPVVPIARAEGVWLHDFDGHRYLDGVSSWWVNLFGHNHPSIRAALIDQLGQLDLIMLAGFTHAPVVELSEKLAALTGLGHASYASDGASATEIALKMSAHFWRNTGQPGKCCFAGVVLVQPGFKRQCCPCGNVCRAFARQRLPCIGAGHCGRQPDQWRIGFTEQRNVGHR